MHTYILEKNNLCICWLNVWFKNNICTYTEELYHKTGLYRSTLHQEILIVSLFSHGGTTFVHRISHSTTGKQTKVWEFSKFSCIRRPSYICMLLSCTTLHSSCIVRYIRMYSFIICNGLLLVYCTDIRTYALG